MAQSPGGVSRLEQAGRELRAAGDTRWVEISDRVLDSVLSATRRSHLLAATTPMGPFHVSEQVVVAHLRHAIDAVPGAAVTRIHLDVKGRDTLTGVVVELIAQYGQALVPLADRVRDLATAELAAVVGPVAPAVDVRAWHVHFRDVVREDPHGVDPWDPHGAGPRPR